MVASEVEETLVILILDPDLLESLGWVQVDI